MKPPIGTPLKDGDLAGGKVLTSPWRTSPRYGWDRGWAIGKYLEGLKAGKIRGIRCPGCGRTLVPPRAFCELCFRPLDQWVELRDTGTINTFSICYVTWDMKRLETPLIPAVVEIDGATKGMGIMHHLGGIDPKRIRIGMKVRAVWRPEGERTGAITDIRHFQPVEA